MSDMYKNTRKTRICEPRMVSMVLLRTVLGWSLERIGGEFDRSSANTVNAVNRVRDLYLTDKEFKRRINAILDNLIFDEMERQKVKERIQDDYRKDERYYRDLFEKQNA